MNGNTAVKSVQKEVLRTILSSGGIKGVLILFGIPRTMLSFGVKEARNGRLLGQKHANVWSGLSANGRKRRTFI